MPFLYSHETNDQPCRHTSLPNLLRCNLLLDRKEKIQIVSGQNRRTFSPNETDLLTTGRKEQKDLKEIALNCTLSPMRTLQKQISPTTLIQLTRFSQKYLSQINYNKRAILESHLFHTIPKDHQKPNSLTRFLAIDMVEHYQQQMNPWLEQILESKNQLLEDFKIPTDPQKEPEALKQINQALRLPSYKLTKIASGDRRPVLPPTEK